MVLVEYDVAFFFEWPPPGPLDELRPVLFPDGVFVEISVLDDIYYLSDLSL